MPEQLFRNTITLLRFPFSLFLMPTFFFAWSQSEHVDIKNLILVFVIMHLLVYPASNGYNSYMDRDTGSIGGIENPPPPSKSLFYVTIILDIIALLLSLLVNYIFLAGVIVYILCSRAYSYRGIRLKQYPITGFITVFLVQGAITYFTIFKGIGASIYASPQWLCMLASSLLIGALYPLTQIYQHQQDREDGVISISYKLGYRGTFIFSGLLFVLANLALYLYFNKQNDTVSFFIFSMALLPAVAYFFYWAIKVFNNSNAANFKNSLLMNTIAAFCTNIAFVLLTILKH
jgi:1,4-dihydroxy-2-naphthoate octaprenyltransferase